MYPRLITQQVQAKEEIRNSFDRQAQTYAEQHGNPDKLFAYRLGLFEAFADFHPGHTVLDIGCGNGHHLRGLCHLFKRGIGIDFSPAMVRVATERSQGANLEFYQDDATQLRHIATESVDRVICSGALEHMIDQQKVIKQVWRVLKPGGRFVCLTLNGGFVWYRLIAPRLGYQVKHYSTDHFFTRRELATLAWEAGFGRVELKPWTFVPHGDIPWGWGHLLQSMDKIGHIAYPSYLRGGLCLVASKPR